MRTLCIYNAKGGVGKTTSAMGLASYLAVWGKKTLLVDFDPQGNATSGLGVLHQPEETIYHALLSGQDYTSVIKKTHLTSLDVVPASQDLAGALIELVALPERETYLRNFIEKVRESYEFIIIDLGPSLNLLTVNGLLAADEVLIPIQCEYYSLEGVSQLLATIEMIRNNLGHKLKIAGALLTMYDDNQKLSEEVADEIRKNFPHYVYEAVIPRSISLAEAPSFRRPIVLYAPQSPGAQAYEKLALEVIRQGSENGSHDENDIAASFRERRRD